MKLADVPTLRVMKSRRFASAISADPCALGGRPAGGNNSSAKTLMLSRSMSPMVCASGGDESAATSVAPRGAWPSRAGPSTATPASCNAACTAPAANSGGLSATNEYLSGPDLAPIVPRTLMLPSDLRFALMRPPDPPTTRTELSMGIDVVAGSSVTTAVLPSGLTDTQTTFSFRDNADTRAA